jgi:hypothetical protein
MACAALTYRSVPVVSGAWSMYRQRSVLAHAIRAAPRLSPPAAQVDKVKVEMIEFGHLLVSFVLAALAVIWFGKVGK